MPKQRSKIRTYLEWIAVRTVIGIIGLFPLNISMRIGASLGKLLMFAVPKLRRTGLRNLEIAMPSLSEQEQLRILRGTFTSLGRQIGFVSHFKKFKPDDIRDLVEVVGKAENFDPAFARGNGVLFFTGHFGSWEVFNLLPPAFGYGMNILVRRIDNPLVESYVDSLRTRFGSVTIGKRQTGRGLYRVLEDGELLGILADLNAQLHDGVFVDFFGVPASTTTSIAKIALKTGAALIPAFAVWDPQKNKYVVFLESEISSESTGDREADIRRITAEITSKVEEFVRRYPDQWLWVHKRWNTRPKGEAQLY